MRIIEQSWGPEFKGMLDGIEAQPGHPKRLVAEKATEFWHALPEASKDKFVGGVLHDAENRAAHGIVYNIPDDKAASCFTESKLDILSGVARFPRNRSLTALLYRTPMLKDVEHREEGSTELGHTIRKHVGQTLQQMQARLISTARPESGEHAEAESATAHAEKPPEIVSTFPDAETAQHAVDFTFFTNNNQTRIHNWLTDNAGSSPKLTIASIPHPTSLGNGLRRTEANEFVELPELYKAHVVLQRAPGKRDGFTILTAAPTNADLAQPIADKYLYPSASKVQAAVPRRKIEKFGFAQLSSLNSKTGDYHS